MRNMIRMSVLVKKAVKIRTVKMKSFKMIIQKAHTLKWRLDSEDGHGNEDGHQLLQSLDCRKYPMYPMAHMLQLVIKIAYGECYKGIIMNAIHLVGQVRKSTVLVENFVQ